jgi:hypothetical protein
VRLQAVRTPDALNGTGALIPAVFAMVTLGPAGRLADDLSEAQKQLRRRVSLICWECERLEALFVAGESIDLEQLGQLTDRIGRACQRSA